MTTPRGTRAPARLLVSVVPALAVLAAAAAGPAAPQDPKSLGFTKSVVLEVANPAPIPLPDHPIVLKTAELRAAAPDFNAYSVLVFDRTGGGYLSVSSQADDLDKDKSHDELVLVHTLPASSTVRLEAFYAPRGAFQMMMAPRTDARLDAATGALVWESTLAGFRLTHGQVVPLGKLYETLSPRKPGAAKPGAPEWGMALFDAGDSAGLGGLALWEDGTRVPVYDPAGRAGLAIERSAPASGPVRALAQARFPSVKGPKGAYAVTLRGSAFAGNAVSRQEVSVETAGAAAKPAGTTVCGPGVRKLAGGSWTLDEKRGFASTWGKGGGAAGNVGLAVIFAPGDFAGIEESATDRFVRLKVAPGRPAVHWLYAGWDRGLPQAGATSAKEWDAKVADLAERLLAPVKVTVKAR